MINVVGRPPLDAARVRLCTFEHVLCDTSSMPCDWLPCHTEELREAAMVNGTVPITLENLGQIRRDPCCSAENFVLDSCDDAARELESAFGAEGGAVVCDLTTVDEGRDVDGLARVAARLGDERRGVLWGVAAGGGRRARQRGRDPSRARASARRGRRRRGRRGA